MRSRIRITAVPLLGTVLLVGTLAAALISSSHSQSHRLLPASFKFDFARIQEFGNKLISRAFNSSTSTSFAPVASTLSSLSPSNVRAGEPGLTLTVNGSGFVVGSIVRFNGLDRSTTFISATQLTGSIQALDLTTVGTYPITVIAPDLSISNALNLSVIPSIANLSPLTAVAGSPAFTLTVRGTGFVNGAVVKWNGSKRTTTFVNSTKLTASINATDIAALGSFNVTVQNPPPTSLTTPAIKFFVTNAPPATQCATNPDVTLAEPGLINSGPARSQMWRNDNTWWGAFSNNTDGIYFYKQTSPTTWAQGPLIDANFVAGTFVAGAPDVLWNGTNLFILIQESSLAAKLFKYTYAAGTQTYSLVAGFPVTLPLVGIGTSTAGKAYGTLAIDQDNTGKLWAAYSGSGLGGDGNVRVIFATSEDHLTWDTTGVILASGLSTLQTEGTAILHFGSRLGVAWSDTVLSQDAFRFHNDADPPATWSAKEIIDSGLGPLGLGTVAGKQITMKAAPDGRIFFVGNDKDGRTSHLHLYVRTAAGSWGSKTLIVPDYTAEPTKPVLLLDTDNSEIHVVYKDSAIGANGLKGQTFITQASMNSLAFNSACILMDTSDSTVATSNPTSTKQNLNATTDLVAASSTGRRGNHILTNTVDITPNVLTIFSLVPKEATAGESTLTLTVNGKLFANGCAVRFNGANIATTFVSAAKVTASIPSASLATAGTYPVIVNNPGNVDSNVKNFLLTGTNPLPIVTTIGPRRELLGNTEFTMFVNGSGFRRSSIVRFNGSNRATQFVSDTLLTATILASDQLVAGPYPISVVSPSPGGGISNVTKNTTFYVEPICLAPLPTSVPGVTLFNTNKNQMWYNDGLWWGALSDDAAGVYFYKQNGVNFTKGALLDNNFNGRPDVLWNGTNLFVLVYEFNTQAKFYKYTYNSITKTYAVVSGFPLTLPLIGIGNGTTESQTGSVTIAQDSTGKMWATYPGTGPTGDGNFRVIWSTSADHKTWDTNGFILATGGALFTQEVMNIVHFGGNKIGIAWSHQLSPIEDGFRYHIDGQPENVWSAKEVIDSGLGSEEGFGGIADNHGSMKAAPDGRIFLVAKDSDGAGYLHLYIRSAAGLWGSPVLISPDPQASTTRPTLLLDLENDELYVLYEDANQSRMYLSKASMTAPVFAPACPWIDGLYVVDSTSTKQNLKASMGLMAAASTGLLPGDIYFNPIALSPASGNVPTLTGVSLGANSSPITLTINGSNFASNAVVYFNGMDRSTTFVSPTQLTATLLATDLAAPGIYPITVMNPKGGISTAVNLTISAVVSSLSPASVTAGDPAFTLTVNGIGFVSGATVNFNGVVRPATFVNSTQLTTQISATDVQTFGNLPVTVVNPDGATSPPSNFMANNVVPTLTAVSPSVENAGAETFMLTANGANFNSSSVVTFNGSGRATSFVSGTQVIAQISASDIATGGVFPITVFNPLPGGGSSGAVSLTVNNPAPMLSSITPVIKFVGDVAFVLTVNGTNLNSGSIVRLGGTPRPTTFVSPTQLTAQLTAADVQATGAFPITVFNPAPAGGASSAINLVVENPVPAVTSILPASKIVGDAAFVLTVNGTGFVNSSAVHFNGSNRTTTFVNATQVTASITAADVVAAGTFPITVFNPLPGGGTSNASSLAVNNPAPTLTTIAPSTKLAGDAAFTLTLNGTNFNNNSVVQLGGAARPTTLVNSTQLTASLAAADLTVPGVFPVTVFNPLPGGGSSTAVNLTVTNPAPTLSSIAPTVTLAGDAAFVLTVNGTNFNSSSIVRFSGANRPTTLVSSTQVTAQLTAADVQAGGTFPITVFNPTPGGGTSTATSLTVNNPTPTITDILPVSKNAGDAAFVLTVNGTGFVSTSVVRLNGSNRTTTFVSSTQLTAQITATDVAAAGTPAITVFNPAPVGGTSGPITLTVNNPLPTVTSISPTSRSAGGSSFTLTVNGTGFLSTSVIRFNGSNRTTTFVNNTRVTTSIPSADIAGGGFFPITVFNALPGGGLSNAIDLAVNNPVPTLTSILPTSTSAGTAAFVVTVNGTNFNISSVVRFNGLDRVTTRVSSTQLTAQITAADIAAGGLIPITVFNPLPNGGTTTAINLTVNNPTPTLTSISPTIAPAGGTAFTLTVNGTNFNSSSIVRLVGANRPTTLVSPTQLTAQLTAADIQVTGTFPITVFNAAPGGGTSSAVDLTLNNPLPTITTLAPNNIPEASAAFALTINGSNFVSSSVVEWNGQSRSTSFVNGSQLTAQVSASDVATAGTASVTVINPGPGGGTSNATTFTIDVNGRILSVVNSSGAANSNLTVLITLASQGDENSVSFSLTFDPALLSNPQAVLGDDASGASLSTDTSEVAQGRYGVAVTLPVGQTFSSGLRQIVRFTFGTAAVASETTTPVGFTDPPLARRVLNAAATDLATVYNGGTVTITLGYEADVAPRPNGSNNGTVSIADWVQVGRFSSGLDTANAGSEFQRADCAPRATLGNDSISIADWVQAGRYASGLDFVFAAGGPTGAPSAPQTQAAMVTTDRAKGTESELAESTKVNLVSTVMPVGQNSSVSIEFDALGNENAFGFSLMFDPAKLSFVSAEKSSEASVATLNVNKLEATKGRVGIALALPAGRTFALGKHQLVVLTFAVPADGSEPGAIFFTDQPIGREVVDLNANRLAATFQDALGVNPLEDARFFVQQQYLDFLNRSGESGGLNYWTEQISECGSDLVCVGQRRIAVSAAFFMEPEFQQTGYAVYRLYQAAYGRGPTYAEFSNDRGRLQAGEQLAASTLEFANQFVEGAEFKAAYPKSLSATEFVNKLYETAGLSQYASEKQQAVLEMRTRSKTRAQVLLELIDNLAFKEREYNRAFVLMQYFGYLRREPDQPGYDFWLNVLNNKEPGNYRSMVCSFITSHEYQERFSSVVARSNQECVH